MRPTPPPNPSSDLKLLFQQLCTLNLSEGVTSELLHHLHQDFYENEGLRPKPQSFETQPFH